MDIAALDENGFPIPSIAGRFGTEIATVVEINGIKTGLMPGQAIDIEFNFAGRCGLSVQTFGSLIPDTFW